MTAGEPGARAAEGSISPWAVEVENPVIVREAVVGEMPGLRAAVDSPWAPDTGVAEGGEVSQRWSGVVAIDEGDISSTSEACTSIIQRQISAMPWAM